LNSGLASADSGNPVGSGGSRYTVSQRRSGPCGLFSLAEDKVKLSDDVIEVACTRSATVVHLYYHALCNPLRILPHEWRFKFYKHSQLVIRVHSETLSVVAMGTPLRIHKNAARIRSTSLPPSVNLGVASRAGCDAPYQERQQSHQHVVWNKPPTASVCASLL
jgi:hypothetical protein